MKNYFTSLFDATHIQTTMILLIIALLLIIVSLSWGISDNLPAIAMLSAGIIIFFFSITYGWKKVTYYATLIAVCGIILPMVWGNQMLGEGVDFAVGGICIAGIVTGLIGIFIRSAINIRNKLRPMN